jgi:hypothetical protein
MKHNRFSKGSGVYKCVECGKLTRDTGEGASIGLCGKCYLKDEWYNSLVNEKITEEEYNAKCAEIDAA